MDATDRPGPGEEAPFAVEPIAVIGLACRLPGARDAAEFWQNLAGGVESIRPETEAEQAARGVPEAVLRDPHFVSMSAVLDDYEYLDAAFFGMSSREAELRDPQHRLFLELAYTALEDAGYDPGRYDGEIGVYAGSGEDGYQWRYTRRNARVMAGAGLVGVAVSSHPDYVATFASYKLNLRGPSLTLHTACSTSLVALHVACEALRGGECDMAVTGGVSIDLPAGWGYVYQEGGVNSPDGRCRAFDAAAAGTMWGSGGGVVVLKRLSEALRDRDHVRAVVLGNAVNNDGSAKVGFTAPSERGQAAVVAQALAVAGVDPRSISYVEAHGTGTLLGDPIEVAALSQAYHRAGADAGWCAIGSVKTNIGHLGPAAGIAGVIKTVLSLEHGLIPASLHYEKPNPKIDFGRSPFYVNASLSAWKSNGEPRRAGVSSFGMGGTNAHVIMQEAPQAGWRRPEGPAVHLLPLSARTPAALATMAQRLATRLSEPADGPAPALELADVSYTLRTGRREHSHRLAIVASDAGQAAAALGDPARWITTARPAGAGKSRPATSLTAGKRPQVALMFSGQGAQYAGMGGQLYRAMPAYREVVDECTGILLAGSGLDLRATLGGLGGARDEEAEEAVRQTGLAQPALFVLEYALARLWQSWGIEPDAMIGHSIGEYVAATLAGVFTLPSALHLVAERGRLMQSVAPGAMLAVQLAEAELQARLPQDVSIAAVNGPATCVVAGPREAVGRFAEDLSQAGVGSRPLRTSHAFHSAMMEPVLAGFRAVVAAASPGGPARPFVSNVTGEWITPGEAADPSYWARHVREPVRFGEGLRTLLGDGEWLLLECGPGRQLCGLARLNKASGAAAVPSLPHRGDRSSDCETITAAAGLVWAAGAPLDLRSAGVPGYRVPLPAYPWERKYFWIEPDSPDAGAEAAGLGRAGADEPLPVADWFAVPVWRQLPPVSERQVPGRVLLFAGQPEGSTGEEASLEADLRAAGAEVVRVSPGAGFGRDGSTGYTVRPAARDDYDELVAQVSAAGGIPGRIVHAWAVAGAPAGDAAGLWQAQDLGFFSLLSLAQALAATQPQRPVHLDVLTAGTADVTGADLTRPEHATVTGIARVLPLEMPWLTVRHIDIAAGAADGAACALRAEVFAPPGSCAVALRGPRRWQREFSDVRVGAQTAGLTAGPGLREHGVYLITGGLGGIGITLARDLARRVSARLVLVSRAGLPPRGEWDEHLGVHGPAGRAGRAITAIGEMEAAGAEVLVVTADVVQAAGARHVRDEAIARFGRVDGIVHAAGVPGGGMAEVKDRAAAEEVLRPKLAGTLALRDAFADDGLDFVVLCSSVTAVAGGFGQVDYCAANAFLDAHARTAHGWGAPVVSVNWGSWREVGMAAEVAAPAAFRALQRGERLIPLRHPVLTGRSDSGADGAAWCRGVISPGTHWVLADHRISGVPVLPGTGYLEVVRAALTAVSDPPSARHVAELRDVVFIEPLAVPDGTSAELRVNFSPGADGLDFEVVSLSGGQARAHARGVAAWADPPPATPVDLAAIQRRCAGGQRDRNEGEMSISGGLVAFGPRWGNLSRTWQGQDEDLALLEATEPTEADLSGWLLHPALLDEAVAFGRLGSDGSYLPLGYGRVTVRSPLPARLWSHLSYRDTGGTEVLVSDVSLLDDSGQELVSISDFTLRKVQQDSLLSSLARPTDGAPATAAGPAEPLAGHAMTGGIGPADGAEAFSRLTHAGLGPQVVISAIPIAQVIASARQITQETVEEALTRPGATRPGQPAEGYLGPRNDLEATIAQLWGEVLGDEQIGMTDDFFDVGGNSLIAVQLISMLRKETGVRLPMRALFEHPTIAGTAELVADLLTTQQAATDGQPGQPPTPSQEAAPAIPRVARPEMDEPGGRS